jgi:hypothetical protein
LGVVPWIVERTEDTAPKSFALASRPSRSPVGLQGYDGGGVQVIEMFSEEENTGRP